VSAYVELAAVEPVELAPGVRARFLFGDAVMLSLVELDPACGVPLHDHPHEQAGLVLDGEVVFTIGGEERRLGPGDAFRMPPGVEHGASAGPGGARLLDVFTPVREDYRARAGL
jgi:quercetin dioxygenase-like cupin family protein